MKNSSEKSSRVTRGNSGNRQTSRSRSRSPRKRVLNREQSSNAKKRKRSSDPVADEMREIQEPVTKVKKRDQFCWICHKLMIPAETDEFCCPDCPRSYHNNCLKRIKAKSVCECKWTTVDGSSSSTNEHKDLYHLLRFVYWAVTKESPFKSKELNNDAKMYNDFFRMWPNFEENPLLCEIVDFSIIEDNLRLGTYKCTGQFYQEVKWIHHNSYIINPDHKYTTLAVKLEKAFKKQMSYAEGCAECYLHINEEDSLRDSFIRVCNNPHLIVWAKLKGFPYWPAKCLRIVNGNADVRFFGTHDKSLIPLAQVYKISIRNPGSCPKKSKASYRKNGYENAMEDLSEYIRNYEAQYGTFKYFPEKTSLTPMKKSQNKKRQNKKKNQNDAALNAEDDTSFTNEDNHAETYHHTENNHAETYHHADLIETKVPIISSMHSSFALKNLSDVTTESSESAMDSSILCHMTFTEETPGDNASDEAIETVTHNPFSETSHQDSEIFIEGSEKLNFNLPSFQAPSVTAEISSDVPSTSSPLVIASTHSLSNQISEMFLNSGNENVSESTKLLNKVSNSSTFSNVLLEEEEDEVQILCETRSTQKVGNFASSPEMIKVVCELLFGNKPHVRRWLQQLQSSMGLMYIKMWLDANNTFSNKNLKSFYEKLCKRIVVQSKHITSIEEENKVLKEKNLKKEKMLQVKEQIIQKQIMELNLYKKKVRNLVEDIEELKSSNNEKKEQLINISKKFAEKEEEIEYLKKERKNDAEKKEEIEILRREIEMLVRTQEESINKNVNLEMENEKIKKLFEDLTKQRKNELAEKEEEIQSLKAQNEENFSKKKENEHLKNENELKQVEIDHLKKQNELLEKKQNEIFNEKVNLIKENEKIQKNYENLTKQRKDELAENEKIVEDLNEQIKNFDNRLQTDLRFIENQYRVDKEIIEKKYQDQIDKLTSKINNCKCQKDIFKQSDASEKFSTGSDVNLNSSIELTSIVAETTTSSIQMVGKGDGTFEYSEKQTSVKAEQHIHHVQQSHIQQSIRPVFLQEIPPMMVPGIFATPAIVINPEPQHSSQAAPDVIITYEPKPTTSRDLSSSRQSQGTSQAAANVKSVPESKKRQRTSVKKKKAPKSKPRKSYSKSSINSKEESHNRKQIKASIESDLKKIYESRKKK